jgi:N-acetylated-alpha-linked acidic dipeptidase
VAYFNLDMASMGPNFGSAASPELKTVIAEVAKVVPQARDAAKTVYDDWAARSGGEPSLGDLGGGSDHVAFLMHAGVPSASMSAGGSKGNSYHSAYDTLPWYWKTVGDDYEPALMVSRMTTVAAARLADAAVIPYDLARVRAEFAKHVEGFRGSKVWPAEGQAAAIEELLQVVRTTAVDTAMTNEERVRETRRFMSEAGVPGRRWFRNWYVATDENSGYATWVLPGFRKAAEDEDAKAFAEAARVYLEMWR